MCETAASKPILNTLILVESGVFRTKKYEIAEAYAKDGPLAYAAACRIDVHAAVLAAQAAVKKAYVPKYLGAIVPQDPCDDRRQRETCRKCQTVRHG